MTDERGKKKHRKQEILDAIVALMAEHAALSADHEVLNANDEFLAGEHADIVSILQFVFAQLQEMSAALIRIETALANQGGEL